MLIYQINNVYVFSSRRDGKSTTNKLSHGTFNFNVEDEK